MKLIVYAGDELLTGDDIADAVLDYSEAVAASDVPGTIVIPVVVGGKQTTATLLVGPASQMVARDVESDGEELVDEECVRKIHAMTAELRPVARPSTDGDSSKPDLSWMDEY